MGVRDREFQTPLVRRRSENVTREVLAYVDHLWFQRLDSFYLSAKAALPYMTCAACNSGVPKCCDR